MLADKGGDQQRHACGQELIASDVSLLVTFNQAIDGVIQNNQEARQNPKALPLASFKTAQGFTTLRATLSVNLKTT